MRKFPEHVPEHLTSALAEKNRKFSDVENLVDLIIEKTAPSLLLCGQPGIGKTRLTRNRFDVAKLLEGFDYKVVKGHGSALGLYNMLFENRQSSIILDDSDSIFKDPRGIQILKAALDSYDIRLVSWESPITNKRLNLPRSFEFEGSIIFVSNISVRNMDSAVYSRSLHYNLELKPNELLAFMYEIVEHIEPKVSVERKLEVLNHLARHMNDLVMENNWDLRTLINAIRIRQMNRPSWKRMACTCA